MDYFSLGTILLHIVYISWPDDVVKINLNIPVHIIFTKLSQAPEFYPPSSESNITCLLGGLEYTCR